MAVEHLSKPGTITGAILSGTAVGGTAGSPQFYIKVKRARFQYNSPIAETTGDGDVDPRFENSERLYGQFEFNGFMIADQGIAIRTLIAQQDTSGNAQYNMAFQFSGGETTTASLVIIESIGVAFDAEAPFVGLVIRGRYTDERPTSIT